jgi:hypothetical protein
MTYSASSLKCFSVFTKTITRMNPADQQAIGLDCSPSAQVGQNGMIEEGRAWLDDLSPAEKGAQRLSSAKWLANWPADDKVPEVSEAHFAARTTGEALQRMLFRS